METLACGSCSHSISRSPKLPLVFVYLDRNTVHVFYFLNSGEKLVTSLTFRNIKFYQHLVIYMQNTCSRRNNKFTPHQPNTKIMTHLSRDSLPCTSHQIDFTAVCMFFYLVRNGEDFKSILTWLLSDFC